MELKYLLEKTPARYNRAQRKHAEREMKQTLNKVFPIIEAYLTSEKTNESFEKYRKSFENTALYINSNNLFIKVNTSYFTQHVSIATEIEDLKQPKWYKNSALAILIFIAFVIASCIFLYICGV